MSPELTVLIVNAVFIALAVLWVYPNLEDKRMWRIWRYDIAISGAAFITVALLFAGSGVRFTLLGFDTRWWVFSILTYLAMEAPLVEWFRRRHGLDWDD